MYRSGQGFGSFLPSPAVFSHGAAPRGREQGRSPSPGSGPGRRQHPVPGAAPPALPAGGRGEAGGGRPSSGAPSLPHPPIKKRLRCRVPRSAPEAPGAAVGEVLGGERIPGTPPHGARHCQRSSASARRPGFPALPGQPRDPSAPGACPSEGSPAAVGVGSASAPLCAPRCPAPRSSAALHRTDLQAEPPFAFRGTAAALGVRQKVSDPPSVLLGLLALCPPPAPEVPPGPCPTWVRGSRGAAPPHRKVPAFLPGVAKPPPDDPPTTTGSSRPALGAGGGG